MAPIFETERLIARDWTLSDVEAAFRMYGDPEVVRYLAMPPEENIDSQREHLAAALKRYAQFPPGFGFWAIEHKEDGQVLGAVLLKALPDAEEIEVGWHLVRTFWGKGYATEAARGAVKHGFETMKLHEIYAIVLPENVRSINVAKRLGMEHLGQTERFHNLTLEWFRLQKTC